MESTASQTNFLISAKEARINEVRTRTNKSSCQANVQRCEEYLTCKAGARLTEHCMLAELSQSKDIQDLRTFDTLYLLIKTEISNKT